MARVSSGMSSRSRAGRLAVVPIARIARRPTVTQVWMLRRSSPSLAVQVYSGDPRTSTANAWRNFGTAGVRTLSSHGPAPQAQRPAAAELRVVCRDESDSRASGRGRTIGATMPEVMVC